MQCLYKYTCIVIFETGSTPSKCQMIINRHKPIFTNHCPSLRRSGQWGYYQQAWNINQENQQTWTTLGFNPQESLILVQHWIQHTLSSLRYPPKKKRCFLPGPRFTVHSKNNHLGLPRTVHPFAPCNMYPPDRSTCGDSQMCSAASRTQSRIPSRSS